MEHYVYAYAGGRLASETRNGGPATVYAYDAQGQVIGDGNSSYAYDLAGNRTGPLLSTGPLNELLTDGSWNYQYDASGRLVAKLAVVDATDRWTYIRERTPTGKFWRISKPTLGPWPSAGSVEYRPSVEGETNRGRLRRGGQPSR